MERQRVTIPALFVMAVLCTGSQGFAQAVIPELPDATVEITAAQTELVERYIRGVARPPVVEERITLKPGRVIPESVPLNRFAGWPQLERYAYFVSVDHKIVVADPRTRVIVRILDQKS